MTIVKWLEANGFKKYFGTYLKVEDGIRFRVEMASSTTVAIDAFRHSTLEWYEHSHIKANDFEAEAEQALQRLKERFNDVEA